MVIILLLKNATFVHEKIICLLLNFVLLKYQQNMTLAMHRQRKQLAARSSGIRWMYGTKSHRRSLCVHVNPFQVENNVCPDTNTTLYHEKEWSVI